MVNYSGENMTDDNVSAPFAIDRDDQNGDAQKQDDKPAKVQYTIPGVLHFIQHEWAKFEMERAQWDVERAELQARIAFLQGERKGQENLKNDLVRRIKMLEYALKQERLKNHRLVHGTSDAGQVGFDAADAVDGEEGAINDEQHGIPADVDAVISIGAGGSNQATQPNSSTSWRQGRQLLRQYLQEIGYTDTILDVRSFRVRSLLGLNNAEGVGAVGGIDVNGLKEKQAQQQALNRAVAEKALLDSEQSVLATLDFLASGKGNSDGGDQDSGSDDDDTDAMLDEARRGAKKRTSAAVNARNLDSAEEEALNEFHFLGGDKADSARRQRDTAGGYGSGGEDSGGENWSAVDYQALNRKKEQYQKEAMTKKGSSSHRVPRAELQAMIQSLNVGGDVEGGASANGGDKLGDKKRQSFGPDGGTGGVSSPKALLDSEGIGLGDLAVLSQVDESDPVTRDVNIGGMEDSLRKTWSVRYTLRSHFDCVRAMSFHPVEAVLLTASEDGTMKLWNLQKFHNSGGGLSPTHGSSPGGNGKKAPTQDLEPVYTFRGHDGAVLCLCMSPTGDSCYTGGIDGTVRCWTLPPPNVDPYDVYDASVLTETLRGHDDAVWSVAFHTSDNRLISASADGTLKLWEPGVAQPLLRTFQPESDQGVPTSVDFVSTDPQQAVAAYTSSSAFIYDLETGKSVLRFESRTEDPANSRGQINQIVSHPTLPITITAHEDRMIRFFDNNTGKLIDAVVAHLDSVTCISIDPNGLYLLSGSHDGSLRLWNFDTKTCLQEITAHRRKFDESVMSVAFHSSRPLIASAGADGLAKVFV